MSASRTTDLAFIGVFAALIALLSLLPGIPIGPVPITLQTLGVSLAGLILGPWRGFAATALYLLVGFAGLPVFAGGFAGLAVLGRPSIGYLLSFPVAALAAGFLAQWTRDRRPRLLSLWISAFAASLLLIHPAGIVGLMVILGIDMRAAFLIDVAFWPGDIVKCLLAAAITVGVHRAFPDLLRRRPAPA